MGTNTSKIKPPASAKHPAPVDHPVHVEYLTHVNLSTHVDRPAPVETKAVVLPRLPQEIIDEILDRLAANQDPRSLQSCALVSKSWSPSCRRLLFHTIIFITLSMERWLERFPVPEDSPAHLVKNLYVWIGASQCVPDRFFEYTPWFTNAERLSLMGYPGIPLLRRPSLWRSPQSVTSLTVKTGSVTLVEIRDIMAQLPNLDSLWLSGDFVGVDRRAPQGIGTILKGRFGGKLRLSDRYAGGSVTNMLLEVPTGIHFTECQIECPRELLLSNVQLLKACGSTLVRLSYKVNFERKSYCSPWLALVMHKTLTLISPPHIDGGEFGRSLDFSKLPNLRVVILKLSWTCGGLQWIPMALSTIKPATSPRLSTIRVDLIRSYSTIRSVECLVEETCDDLRWVANEALRIEREFDGAVNLTISRDQAFKVALDVLDVRVRFRGVDDTL